MSRNSLERHASIDAQLRLLAPGKVSEDDKLVEYDALLVDRFLDILQCLHGEDLREMVQECYEISAKYEGTRDLSKLDELGNVLMSLDPWDSILLPSSFSHMLNLGNLAEEVQIAHRGRNFQIEKAFKLLSSAILRGLITATRQRYSCIKMQSDSKVAIDIINGNASAPWTCWPTLSRIRAITNKHSIHFSFVHRQANQPADYLSHASHHISAEDTIIRPGDFPQQLQNLITRDKQQMAYIRI